MLCSDIIRAVHAEPLVVSNEERLTKDYKAAFASDLMSDALALIQDEFEHTILITGLCNAQVLRTAEMLDLETVLFVRGKKLAGADLMMAQSMDINLFTTTYTMYETCGILYGQGLGSIS
ncbi:MAG: hypothetical protein IKF00_13835 [Solobacterium sp.]|jgi:hypothetical protein|nr:hypothetical protein [Solobacterium sp.]MDO4193882.1 hypothetical protein [Erysipelotrichaceae bacterium]MBQ6488608.1 hypothetical protein [Solobacterium sp.]MBR2846278.1 hypothetical protein [Solobacterium sp.]MBR3343959.1 hypothetical protein [Solobacterium sp.]